MGSENEEGGRFEDITDAHDRKTFLEFLVNYDFVALHIKDKRYLIIPIEDVYPRLIDKYYFQ